jgi:hypothetical protein
MYTCPVHPVIEQSKPGVCRICSRTLVQMTAALTFTCAGNREIEQIEPGKCEDGAAMIPRYTKRAHGDHNPKHGGIFFMAPDNWHHLEGTYPAAGRFRIYIYDDYSRPLPIAEARKVRGRVVTKEMFDAKAGTTRELASAPLVLARNGAFFEARIDPIALPAKMTAKISFRSDDKESRFDFVFPMHSRDLPAPAAPIAPDAPSLAPSEERSTQGVSTLLNHLKARRSELEALVKDGSLSAVFLPALQAKDLALEIQGRQDERSAAHRDAVEVSVKQIVLAAYQLDNYGDLGDGEKVQDAFRRLHTAVAQLESLVSGQP